MSFSVYVHLPFCATRCDYCDFVSTAATTIPFDEYTAAVHREWAARAPLFEGACASVYVGGGTPSLWPAPALARLLAPLIPGGECEVTVELNPGDCDRAWLEAAARAGVNRLSVGVQALDDDRLRWLTRRHDSAQARRAVIEARRVGAFSVSADIIYGTPRQDAASLSAELTALLDLGPDHVSAYELTVTADTPLGRRARRRDLGLPGSDEMIELWSTVGSLLSERGLARYEVSSYARAGHRSRHNERYWRGGVYAGLGAGAHGFSRGPAGMIRYANTDDINEYMGHVRSARGVDGIGDGGLTERLTAAQHALELVMLGLRTTDGVRRDDIAALIDGDRLRSFDQIASALRSEGFVSTSDDRVVPTAQGLLNADLLAARFTF